MRLSIAIQTHPVREVIARELAAAIASPVQIAFDPEPDATPSPWRTYRHALETTPAGATHRLVIQDDAMVCRSFAPTVERAITARPDRLVSLWVGGLPHALARAVYRACQADEPWAELPSTSWCPAVALVWPVDLIPVLLAYVDEQRWPVRFTADDEIIGRFCRGTQRQAIATVPSLVEHPDDVPSLKGNQWARGRNRSRVAACFIADHVDPLSIAW